MTEGGFADPANYYYEWTMEHTENSTGDELAMRLDADIQLDTGWLDSMRVGVRRAERDQKVNWSTYNWGSVNPLWGVQGDEAYFANQGRWAGTTEALDFGPNLVGGGVSAVAPSSIRRCNTSRTTRRTSHCSATATATAGQPGCRGNCPVEREQPGRTVLPDRTAGRIRRRRRRLHHAEVRRRRHQDRQRQLPRQHRCALRRDESVGDRWYPVPIWTPPAPQPPPAPGAPDRTDPLTLTPADDIAFMNGGTDAQSGGAEHTNWLPSLNLRFGLTDDTFIRFAVSRALARPDMGLYKNYITVARVGPDCTSARSRTHRRATCTGEPTSYTPRYTGTAGNPQLAPTTADQIDLTYEWYFSNTGSLTMALFAKSFNDYIQYGSYLRTFTNNGVTRDVSVTGPITGDGARLKGFEIAYQQFFDALPEPWNGLGVQANYTYVDNQGITNANLTTVSGSGATQQDPLITFTDLPLEGYSPNSYNLVAMFERPKFGARLAWNWRDRVPDQPVGLLHQAAHLAGCVRPARRVDALPSG
jgi:hypothetical protein